MNCYDCGPEARPAVACCRLCGKGLCRAHCVRREREVLEHLPSGMAAQVRPTDRRIPRMLCAECAEAVGTADVYDRIEIHR